MSNYDTFEEFARSRTRFGWSIERIREHYRINQGIRNRYVPDLIEDIELNEFDIEEADTFEEIDIADEEITFDDPLIEAEDFLPIEEVGESTALLGGGTTATSSTGTVLTGVGILGGSGIIGGLVSHFSGGNDDDRPVVSLPDHNFIGPGNPHDSGLATVDLDDDIAKEHDTAYANAENAQDVREADDNAIHDFISDVIDTGNPHSVIGALGIGTKRKIEQHTGVVYPPNLPGLFFTDASHQSKAS